MDRIAVIADPGTALCFRTLGVECCAAETPEQARRALGRLAKEGCALILLTEQLARALGEELARYQGALTPAVILIPGQAGSLGIAEASVKAAVEKAVGADIL